MVTTFAKGFDIPDQQTKCCNGWFLLVIKFLFIPQCSQILWLESFRHLYAMSEVLKFKNGPKVFFANLVILPTYSYDICMQFVYILTYIVHSCIIAAWIYFFHDSSCSATYIPIRNQVLQDAMRESRDKKINVLCYLYGFGTPKSYYILWTLDDL